MKVFILLGSAEGQTEKICRFIFEQISKEGHQAFLANVKDINSFNNDYDFYIIASSIHSGEYNRGIKKFVKTHYELLNQKPSAFISVSLTAAGKDAKAANELAQITRVFLSSNLWSPAHVIQVAGALRYSKYNFIKKLIMKAIARKNNGDTDTSQDHEYTDWEQVRNFIKAIINDHSFVRR